MARVFVCCLVLICTAAMPAFAQNGTVSGTVTRSANSIPVIGVSVTMCTESACYAATTNAIGAYSISAPAGAYYLYTQNSVGLIDEIYNNIQCRGYCNYREVSGITALVVTSGGTLTNRNFALDVGGSVAGTIINAATSAPVAGVTVYAYYVQFDYPTSVAYATTNAAGVYSIGGLATGSYYLATNIANGLINEIYNNVQCVGECDSDMVATSGQAVPVTQGVPTSGINFALDRGGSVSGTVRNSATSAPLVSVAVHVVAVLQGRPIEAGNANTNGAGQYTVTGLPTGTYTAYTRNQGSFINEVYNGIQCLEDCEDTLWESPGTPIPVTAGALTPNRNFDLEPGGVISGVVTRTATSAPLAYVQVRALIRDTAGEERFVGSASTNASGAYSIPRLMTGTYYLYTDDSYNDSVNEIFADVPCLGQCRSEQAIERGTGVAVTAGATISGRNFALDLGGKLSGTVRSGGGAPIDSAYVSVYAKEPSGEIRIRR